MPTGVQLTSRSQLPGAGGHAPTAPPTRVAPPRPRAARLRACTRDRARRVDASATPTARAAPPAPSIAARSPRSVDAALAQRRAESRATSVLPPIQRPSLDPKRVDRADPLRDRVDARRRGRTAPPCSGIVTLAPLSPMRAARTSTKSSTSAAGSGRYTASSPAAAERRVVHRRRHRMRHRRADDAVERGGRGRSTRNR